MVSERIEESKANNSDAGRVDSAKFLEYIHGDKNAAGNAGTDVVNIGLLPAKNWSEHDSDKLSSSVGNLQLKGLFSSDSAIIPRTADGIHITSGLLDDTATVLKDTAWLAGNGSAMYMLAQGSPHLAGMAFAGIAGVTAYNDFQNLSHQTTLKGAAIAAGALVSDVVMGAGGLGMALKGVDGGGLPAAMLVGGMLERLVMESIKSKRWTVR
jgi:hypothetical protein